MKVVLRQATADDTSFIYSSWLKSYRNTQKHVNSETYFKGQHDLITLLLNNSSVIVICPEDDPESIVGYMVYSDDVLHWIYVKSVFRNLGMAKTLMSVFPNGEPKQFSHFTPAVYFLLKESCTFNPYAHLEAL
jgi:hypothetical protein